MQQYLSVLGSLHKRYDTILWFSFWSSRHVWLWNLRYFIFSRFCQGKESIWRSGDIAPSILNFCIRRRWVVRSTSPTLYPKENPRGSLNGRKGGIHRRLGYLAKKIYLIYRKSKEICRLFSQWPSHYTDRAIPASLFSCRNDVEMSLYVKFEFSARWLRQDAVLCIGDTDVKLSNMARYLLTPWCRVLLEKLTGLQLVKKFPAFHGTRRFITALTSVCHLSLS